MKIITLLHKMGTCLVVVAIVVVVVVVVLVLVIVVVLVVVVVVTRIGSICLHVPAYVKVCSAQMEKENFSSESKT